MAAVYYALVVALVVSAFARGNPGATHQTALWVGVPLIWGTWALTLRGRHLRQTLWTLVLSTCVTGFAVVWLGIQALWAFQVLPIWFLEVQQVTFSVTADSQVELRYAGLSSLVGLSTLALALACLPGREESSPPMWLIRIAAVLAFIAAIVSGRRGLMVVAVLAPILCVAWACLLLARRRWEGAAARKYWRDAALGVGMVVLVTLSPLGTNLTSLVGVHGGFVQWPVASSYSVTVPGEYSTPAPAPAPEPTPSAEGVSMDAGEDSVRVEQASELLAQWREEPLFGHGLGSVLDSGFERNAERPWMFENQPLQILMNIGIVGVAVLMLLCWFMLSLARRASAAGGLRRLQVASGITLVLMMLANATNPYLAAPGHGWAVFLILGVCVAGLTEPVRPVEGADLARTSRSESSGL
jgi:hypothetical protein